MSTRFSIFATLFALAAWMWQAQLHSPLEWNLATAAVVAAAVTMLRPSSAPGFLAFVCLQAIAVFAELPQTNTNRLLIFFVALTIAATAPGVMASGRGRLDPERWYAAFAPLLRIELILVYFFAFWHKLNFDFLNPELSCAAELSAQLYDTLTFLPRMEGYWVTTAAIYGTLLLEAALPLLLLNARTRNAGVAIGWAFHFVLGVGGFYSFSATMIALLFLFVPDDFVERAGAIWRELPLPLPVRRRPRASLIAPGLLIVFFLALLRDERAKVLYFALKNWFKAGNLLDTAPSLWTSHAGAAFWCVWWLYLVPLSFMAAALLVRPGQREIWSEILRPAQPAYLIFPALVLFNGLCPYLGAKTDTSFAMYSNLRTEGGYRNHILIGWRAPIFDYQTELARVIESSNARLQQFADEHFEIPLYVLRKTIWEEAQAGEKGIRVELERNGRTEVVENAERAPDLSAPPSFLERKFLIFRDILPPDANRCAH